jgi:hypothetical protein
MSGADRAIRVSATVAVLGVAGIAAYVSYWHAYEVISAHGETGVTARLEPATIDGLVYCSSMVVLYAARHQLPVPALARWLLALGIVATLAANLAHGWSHGPIGATVAARPAASLVGSYELLLWLIRTSASSTAVHRPGTDHVGGPAGQPTPGLRLVPDIRGDQANSRPVWNFIPEGQEPVIEANPATGPSRAGPDHSDHYPGQHTVHRSTVGAAAKAVDSETEINAAAVAAYRASLDHG